MNNDDFDPDNSSKMTFVWPFYYYDTFSYWISTWHIQILGNSVGNEIDA